MLGLMPLVRIDTRSLSPPQGGQIRTNVVVGLAGVSHFIIQGRRASATLASFPGRMSR